MISLIFLGEKRLFKKNRLGQNHQQEELQQLVSSRKPLEDEIRTLNEVLKEKYEELDKIELRASESLSELSGVEGYINNLEKHSNALESKIGA